MFKVRYVLSNLTGPHGDHRSYLSLYLSISLSIYLSIYLSIFPLPVSPLPGAKQQCEKIIIDYFNERNNVVHLNT